ncbi:hypothetical protein IKA92_04805, partial [bacterium]|nr:hypothetical protein [bacterium]
DGIFILAHDGKILDINLKGLEIFKLSKREVVGKYFSKFIEGGTVVLNNIVNSNRTLKVKSILDGGVEIFLELSAKQSEKSKKVYVQFREITSNYKNETELLSDFQELKVQYNAKNKFFVSINDDILTPIESIEGFSKAMLDSLGGELNEKQAKYVQIILKNAKDLNYNLGTILNYFKLESDLIRFEPRNFDIINLITQEIKRNEELFEAKSLSLNLETQPVITRNCFQDPTIVQEIISNYIGLVLRKTDIGGLSVVIKNPEKDFLQKLNIDAEDLTNYKNYIQIDFEDTSIAYSPTELNELFNPYEIVQGDRKFALGVNFVYPTIKKYLDYIQGGIIVDSLGISGNKTSILFPLNSKG